MRTLRVAHVSTFPPTQCGIATYAEALAAHLPHAESIQVPIVFSVRSPQGQPLVPSLKGIPQLDSLVTKAAAFFKISRPIRRRVGSLRRRWSSSWSDGRRPLPGRKLALYLGTNDSSAASHRALASAINRSPCDVVSLQHEFGLFGGMDGQYVLDLVAALHKPLVTTCHTVSLDLSAQRLAILAQLVRWSTAVVVLSPEEACILKTIAPEGAHKITTIRHGVPDVSFTFPDESPIRRALSSEIVFVSSGHVRPIKGYHLALQALAMFKDQCPRFAYLMLGCVQPQYTFNGAYAKELKGLIEQLGLASHVHWHDAYLPWPALIEHIRAADVGLVTYTEREQASSGVLPLMLALGRPVVATAFTYAECFATHTDGIRLAGWNDPRQICEAMVNSVSDLQVLRRMMRRSYDGMRPYVWNQVGAEYDRLMHLSVHCPSLIGGERGNKKARSQGSQ